MDTSLSRALTKLPKGALLLVRHPRGKGVAVFHGHAWVTQEGDSRDVMLGAGESFALDQPGTAIVQALQDTSLLVFETQPDAAALTHSLDPAGEPGRSRARADAEILEAGPPSGYELHLHARRQRSAAIAEAFVGAVTRLWARA